MILRRVLSSWAVIGMVVFLCGAWLLPTPKLYHQLIIVFLWLPALLALFERNVRLLLKQPEFFLFGLFAAWTLFVLLMQGGIDPVSKSKVPFYVGLTLVGIVLVAQHAVISLEKLLLYASVFGGILAGVSWLDYYFLKGQPLESRVIAIGVWNSIIMAAHAVGALALLGVFMLKTTRVKPWVALLLLLPALGYVLFLGFSQTRGVWMGLAATLLVMAIALKSRKCGYFILLLLAGVGCIALLEPEILLQRGVSYRPELWRGGAQLILEHWTLGVGFNQYLIHLAEGGVPFKHPHNLFLDVGVRFGIPGLLLFVLLWGMVGWRGWSCRDVPLGQALLALWVFASVSLLTDGIGLWLKPNADWLITWLPIGLSAVLASRESKRRLQVRDTRAGVSKQPI
ncbi:O-antigen ligase family protein [Pseudomonas fluorescens]|nr:O-antigen ligase family protein [Pseudomonas fluorescens]